MMLKLEKHNIKILYDNFVNRYLTYITITEINNANQKEKYTAVPHLLTPIR